MANKVNSKAEPEPIGSAFDLLSKSVEIVVKNWQAFVVVNILTILSAVDSAFNNHDKARNEWTYQSFGNWGGLSGVQLAGILGFGIIAVLTIIALGILLYAMSISLQVKSTANKKPNVSELFDDGKKYFFRIISVSLLSGLIITAGLILFIVPGIIAIGRLAMAPYYMVDKNLGAIEAMKLSNSRAIGRMGLIYGAIGVTILVSILAAMLGIIPVVGPLTGAFVTIAYSLVLALRYQELKKA